MDFINSILSDRWLPITIVIVSPLIAFIIDLLFSLIFKGLVRKTKTTIDDKIIKILHGPIFYSAIFIGWMIAIQKTSFIYTGYIVSIFLTIITFLWSKAVFQVFVIIINPDDSTYSDTLTSANEIKARGAKIIGISDKKSDIYDYWIEIPRIDESLYPLLEIIPIQLLAYYSALEKDTDPDYPRNLAKSVTVK